MAKEMDMEYFTIVMEQSMKELGKMIKKKDLVFSLLMKGKSLLDYLKMTIFVETNKIRFQKV